ncbi:winged helix-turn-helix domain-containing protein [Actinoplanes missouriensis]|uniref:winged helix-turn-helix domain-containing protein n=1 Tax=Actinoplanes missouriensis TaxID=1866 RepID=UPI0033D2A556
MTDDVRDRILGLLHAGPATVAGLSARLGLPGGVVSYHVKILEQGGLVRAGIPRVVQGVAVPRYVSTAAVASPPLRIPAPLPGLTWTATGRFPVPVWTVGADRGPDAAIGASGSAPAHPEIGASGSAPARSEMFAAGAPGGNAPGFGSALATPAGDSQDFGLSPAATARDGDERDSGDGSGDVGTSAVSVPRQDRGGRPSVVGGTEPAFPFAAAAGVRTDLGPRLVEVRRVPLDDATFYEFATRLDALTREFAARAAAGAPAAELAIALYRPSDAGGSGQGGSGQGS